MNRIKGLIILSLVCGWLGSGYGAVVDSTSAGFTIRLERKVKTDSMKIYRAFSDDLPKWWDSNHTYSGNSKNLTVQPTAGGCFCEALDGGGAVQHMKVINAIPGKLFRMEGGLGPLQQFPVTGILTLEISRKKDGQMVELKYSVGGYVPGGLTKLAGIVDRVLGQQFERFIQYVTTGQ